jgi:TonB family protein
MREVQQCYETELLKDKTLAGKIVLKLTIAASGTISAASVDSSSLSRPEVGDCVVSHAKNWVFPKPTGETPVNVTFPLVFDTTG